MKPTWYAEGFGTLNYGHLKDGELFYGLDGIYLHGEIQDKAGFDLISIITDDETIPPKIETGQYPITIVVDGKDTERYDCTGYIWQAASNRIRGLVVLDGDQKATDDAVHKFELKREHI